jgi:hypothetical protein
MNRVQCFVGWGAAIVLTWAPMPALAQGQLAAYSICSGHLVPDVVEMQRDINLQLAFLGEVSEASYSEHSRNSDLFGSFSRLGLSFGADVSYEKFDKSRREYFARQGVSESFRDESGVLISKVPQTARDSHVRCMREVLNSPGPSLYPVHVSDEIVIMRVRWVGPPGVSEELVQFVPVNLGLVNGGSFPPKLQSNGEVDIVLRREKDLDTALTVNVGGKSASWAIRRQVVIPNPVPPPEPTPPKVKIPYVLERIQMSGNGFIATFPCDTGYVLVDGSLSCNASDNNHAGPCSCRKLNSSTVRCEWPNNNGVSGVQLRVRAVCEPQS